MQSHGRWHLLVLQSYCVNHSTNFKQTVIQLCNNYTIQGYTLQRLHNKVTQLSSNHLANKRVHYLQTAENQDNILPRGGLWNKGPIQNPLIPSLGSSIHPVQKLYNEKLYSEKGYIITQQSYGKENVQYLQTEVTVRVSFQYVLVQSGWTSADSYRSPRTRGGLRLGLGLSVPPGLAVLVHPRK